MIHPIDCFAIYILLSIPLVATIPTFSDVNVSVEGIIEATVLKHTDWACHWLFANWEARASEGYGVKMNHAGVHKPVILSHKARPSLFAAHHIQFWCVDNRSLCRVEAAVEHEYEVKEMGPYYLACDRHTEQAQFLDAPAYDYEWVPIHLRQTRKVGSCVAKFFSGVQRTGQSGVVVRPGETTCLNVQDAARLRYLSAYMESSAGEQQPSSGTPDESVAYISLTELGTTKTVIKQNLAVVSLEIDHSRLSTYRACAKQKPGSASAILKIISV